jgi:hypothetical protein
MSDTRLILKPGLEKAAEMIEGQIASFRFSDSTFTDREIKAVLHDSVDDLRKEASRED